MSSPVSNDHFSPEKKLMFSRKKSSAFVRNRKGGFEPRVISSCPRWRCATNAPIYPSITLVLASPMAKTHRISPVTGGLKLDFTVTEFVDLAGKEYQPRLPARSLPHWGKGKIIKIVERSGSCAAAYRDQVKAVGSGKRSSESCGKRKEIKRSWKDGDQASMKQAKILKTGSTAAKAVAECFRARRETIAMRKTLMRIIESDQ
ncbi:hypothetical protein BDR06DRAFT_974816 [Suillus hirtellus]|nr:hypothetical protein BDR06DRAFT_974816 [Suillus hirtellus]